MAGDVFYRDVKAATTPRGSIVPAGAVAEEVDGRQILRIPAGVTEIATPIIFPGFTVVIEAESLTIAGDAIEDAALFADNVQALGTDLRAAKQIEVTDTFQARSVRAMTVRGARIEAVRLESDMAVRATEIAVIKELVIHSAGLRAPRLVNQEFDGENNAGETLDWADGIKRGDVPEWLQAAAE
jgi:hypothetical protein